MVALKRFLSLLLVCVLAATGLIGAAAQDNSQLNGDDSMQYTKKTAEISIRDPFVLVHGGKYYMYGTGAATRAGYGCYVSEDLENWAGPFNVFTADTAQGFYGSGCYWAPECHYYNGSFYLFATYLSSQTNHRGTSIFKSSSPLGPFEEITDGHITPKTQDSIDGTLYIDENGKPWMVYVDEWTTQPDGMGGMSAAKLSDDLSSFISEPVLLFKSDSPFWSTGCVTDGPFLYRHENGRLTMLWSNMVDGRGYAVGIAKSPSGSVEGRWLHEPMPLYCKGGDFGYDGGHGMVFTSLDGRLMMAIHSPNDSAVAMTHAEFIELEDTGDTLRLKDKTVFSNPFERAITAIKMVFNKVSHFFKKISK